MMSEVLTLFRQSGYLTSHSSTFRGECHPLLVLLAGSFVLLSILTIGFGSYRLVDTRVVSKIQWVYT